LDEAVDLLKPGGTLFIVGIPDVAMISFNVSKIRRKEITIQNVRRQNHSIQPSIGLCASNKWHPEIMVTHKFYYAQVNKAFETVARYEDKVIKAFVRF